MSIGVVFHNRLTQVQKETVVLFMEVLPFVVTVRPEESFLELVQRVHQEAREALQHRQYSVGNPVHTLAHTVLLHFTRSMQLNEILVRVQRIHSGHGESSLWRHEYFPLTDKDRLLQKASPNFDDSVWEFFEPLMVGARLIMTPPGKHQDSAYLVQLIADQKITAACFVPSMLQVFLQEPGLKRCGCLRRMTTGGEILSAALQNRFSSYLEADLYNGYGPTEATISASFWHCQHGEHGRLVPIGRPIANTQIYLLDSNLQPLPVGVPGEIYIGGAGVARGYLNLPELTAENFIVHPCTNEPGARLYRTGDLARYRPDRNLEFLGRMDNQVKIWGFRIELGEIETVLGQHPAVELSLVMVEDLRQWRGRSRGFERSTFEKKGLR